ncbi:aminotransferase class V-fold PLP-dependent enzyme [Paraliomyxa miuraensis]|uniref:aminotransferase class V-fold PLP-dependent enzyme n=1 Tax=Paraliomyxa miuraensis TaxID=376150 RepID=UPI002253E3B2|nr:aminotransferase class V-fold PLP-dependent enzyme [Paraliomyxa miuraensis]MCX4245887.1 aminotransferase class V-fold PLP-dependent enzyme [Paraliomyxa miuraensis]
MTEPTALPTLARYREDYPILATSVYMNSNSMGAMPRAARTALTEYLDAWEREGVEAWSQWPSVMDQTADGIARMFNGHPGCTTLNQNVAFFQAAVASTIDWNQAKREGRNKVVIEALMFPNVIYVWERFAKLGAELHLVPSDDGIDVPTERILDAIDEHTAIVPLSHAIYVSGALLDVEAICRRAHEVGALVMVDVYQTLGCVPFDVQQWNADFVVGGSHKWLCGGPGTAFLYTRPDRLPALAPMTTGWMGHADPFAFEPAPIRYADGAWRFVGGTPSIPAYYVAAAAQRNLHEAGIANIRTHNLALSRIIVERAQAAGLTIHSPLDGERRTGFVAVDFPGSQEVSRALIEERFKHDWRPNCGLRIGPHFYNTEDEVHRFMDRVIALAGRSTAGR